jgi:hypothetical protein
MSEKNLLSVNKCSTTISVTKPLARKKNNYEVTLTSTSAELSYDLIAWETSSQMKY